MQKKMDFSAKNRINSIVGCFYTGLDARIRRTYRYIRQRVQPFAENTFFCVCPAGRDCTFGGIGERREPRRRPKVLDFSTKKSPEGLIFDSFTAHFRYHLVTITDVTVPFGSDFGLV